MYCCRLKTCKQLKGSAVFLGKRASYGERKQCEGGAAGEEVVIVLTETHSSRSFSQQRKSLIVLVLCFVHCSSDRLWNRQQRRSHHSQSLPGNSPVWSTNYEE